MNGWIVEWQRLDVEERCYWRRVGAFLAVLLVALLLAVLLSSCATQFDGLCAVKPIGQNDGGVAYALVHCEAKP